jgi:hypothetical protein
MAADYADQHTNRPEVKNMDLMVNTEHGYARAKDVKVVCCRCWEELPVADSPAALLAVTVEEKLNDHVAEKHPRLMGR